MYLLYDVIQRRKATLGNSLLVKRGDIFLTHEQLVAAAQSLRVSQTTSDPAIATLRRAIQVRGFRIRLLKRLTCDYIFEHYLSNSAPQHSG
jgi:hypothetical protein